ncbi:MAG: HEAT repeat domain-containing protein [Myxococcales bacterium]|nr:HEAT repeat domain-containing protein [Myxococcales bacterium]
MRRVILKPTADVDAIDRALATQGFSYTHTTEFDPFTNHPECRHYRSQDRDSEVVWTKDHVAAVDYLVLDSSEDDDSALEVAMLAVVPGAVNPNDHLGTESSPRGYAGLVWAGLWYTTERSAEIIRLLEEGAGSTNAAVRRGAVLAMRYTRDPRWLDLLAERIEDEDADVAEAAAESFERLA